MDSIENHDKIHKSNIVKYVGILKSNNENMMKLPNLILQSKQKS